MLDLKRLHHRATVGLVFPRVEPNISVPLQKGSMISDKKAKTETRRSESSPL